MTNSELLVYKCIVQYIMENGYPPTIREIGQNIGMTASGVFSVMMHLECDGWIKTKRNSPRAIKVIGYKFVEEECI